MHVEPYKLLDDFPDIRGCDIIAIDTETDDPGIGKDMGPSALRGEGSLLGVGIVAGDFKHYFPVGHETGINYDPQRVRNYLNAMLGIDIPKVGANIPYDMEWLHVFGVGVKGTIRDVQIAEPLLDPERFGSYSLERLSTDYLGVGKDEQLLLVAAEKYGIKYKKEKEIKGHLKKFAPEYVAPYCIEDARLSLEVYKRQIPILKSEDLWPIFELECELIPIFLQMKIMGVRVDIGRANQLSEELQDRQDLVKKKLSYLAGYEVDPWSNLSVMKYFDNQGMKYKFTKPTKKNPEGNPSFTGDFLRAQKDPVCQLIAEWRKIDTMRVRYVEDIVKYEHRGRIHSCVHQLASDDEEYGGAYGTRSGRLSYSHINLQKIPKRDKKWRKLIRSMFLPEDGCDWGQHDYSQQEPRLGVHFAYKRKLSGAAAAVEAYRQPGADFHTIVAEMAGIDRNRGAKPLNLGSWYGMGFKKMLNDLGGDTPHNRAVYRNYHQTFPFIKQLLNDCSRFAEQRGWVKTILGRKAYFDQVVPWVEWEVRKEQMGKGFIHKPVKRSKVPDRIAELQNQIDDIKEQLDLMEEGQGTHLFELIDKCKADIAAWEGKLEVVGAYKALNRVIQGSAADQTKKAIRDIYNYYGHVQHIQIQVHDELDGSYNSDKDIRMVKEIMEHTIELAVPVIVEPEIGPSWGEVKKWIPN